MSAEYSGPDIRTSEELRSLVEQDVKRRKSDLSTDWVGATGGFTIASLLGNVLVEAGLTTQEKVVGYMCIRLYGIAHPREDMPKIDEVQKILDIGYREISDFGSKLSEQLNKYLSTGMIPR